jgi:hypothetical protein
MTGAALWAKLYIVTKFFFFLLYLYAILPITFILNLRYTLFVILPLAVLNVTLIKIF